EGSAETVVAVIMVTARVRAAGRSVEDRCIVETLSSEIGRRNDGLNWNPQVASDSLRLESDPLK
ncbi:MAG: hypothetical protein KAY24_18465, partial [Candidatus Eisenbacteria sp.]|nr:hypothetical protein [Candidatus Eisenbacteria bacterium]